MKNRNFWTFAMGTIGLLGIGSLYLQASQPDWLLQVASGNYAAKLGSSSGNMPAETLPPDSKYVDSAPEVRAQSLNELKTLWQVHDTKPIIQDVLPFATHPLLTVQLAGVKMLGRLEDPAALDRLQSLDKNVPHSSEWMTDPYGLSLYPALPLAIGRIKARDLNGQKKIDVMLSEVGLTFEQLQSLSAKIAKGSYGSQTMAYDVLREVLDVLYLQKKQGNSIKGLSEQLHLQPAQKLLLQNADRPLKEEAEGLLNYLATTRIGGQDEKMLIDYLLDLGPQADAVAIEFSEKIFADRQKYPTPFYYVEVLEALAKREPDDPRFKPLFLRFYKDKSKSVSQEAGGALYDLYGIIFKS